MTWNLIGLVRAEHTEQKYNVSNFFNNNSWLEQEFVRVELEEMYNIPIPILT